MFGGNLSFAVEGEQDGVWEPAGGFQRQESSTTRPLPGFAFQVIFLFLALLQSLLDFREYFLFFSRVLEQILAHDSNFGHYFLSVEPLTCFWAAVFRFKEVH